MPETEDLFANLLLSLAAAAMQQMGKLVNPLTNKTELDLPRAQQTIDLLDALKAKTKGNLSDREDRLFSTLLGDLKRNYIDTLNAQPAASPAPEAAVGAAETKPDA